MSKLDGLRSMREQQAKEVKAVAAPPAPKTVMLGPKIIQSLREAIAGDLARVTIDGQVWTRGPCAECAKRKKAKAKAMRKWRRGDGLEAKK